MATYNSATMTPWAIPDQPLAAGRDEISIIISHPRSPISACRPLTCMHMVPVAVACPCAHLCTGVYNGPRRSEAQAQRKQGNRRQRKSARKQRSVPLAGSARTLSAEGPLALAGGCHGQSQCSCDSTLRAHTQHCPAWHCLQPALSCLALLAAPCNTVPGCLPCNLLVSHASPLLTGKQRSLMHIGAARGPTQQVFSSVRACSRRQCSACYK